MPFLNESQNCQVHYQIMAEDEDGVSNKKSPQNSDNEACSSKSEQSTFKPDLGIEESKYNSNVSGDDKEAEQKSSSSKSSGAIRKEDNPFSFRHFLKRDLSLPGNSTYENTGARPKVYANTVQHSPTKIDIHAESRREKPRAAESHAKDHASEASAPQISESSSSVEIPVSVVNNTESKSNLYNDKSDLPYYHRPNIASEPLGMPSLPDFVQDHILVEQTYLHPTGSIAVDLDNLPDFTFNTNFNQGASISGRRQNSLFSGGSNNYDYELGGASTSNEGAGWCPSLDLPAGAAAAGAAFPDAPHLNLDLTESVNPADRRNNSPRSNTFPLDLPPNAGAESMRLPDFLPVHPGRTSPETEHVNHQLQDVIDELERTRSQLLTERSRRSRLEAELAAARAEISATRGRHHSPDSMTTESDANVAKLKNQIKKLKEDLSAAQAEAYGLRSRQRGASRNLRQASLAAETTLRDLLAGIEQLKSISNSLDQT